MGFNVDPDFVGTRAIPMLTVPMPIGVLRDRSLSRTAAYDYGEGLFLQG
jgi:hypothetical protein